MTATHAHHAQPLPVKRDLRQHVTDIIIQQLEAGTTPWHKPWRTGKTKPLQPNDSLPYGLPKNAATGKTYRGINIVLLWSAAISAGYDVQAMASQEGNHP